MKHLYLNYNSILVDLTFTKHDRTMFSVFAEKCHFFFKCYSEMWYPARQGCHRSQMIHPQPYDQHCSPSTLTCQLKCKVSGPTVRCRTSTPPPPPIPEALWWTTDSWESMNKGHNINSLNESERCRRRRGTDARGMEDNKWETLQLFRAGRGVKRRRGGVRRSKWESGLGMCEEVS